MATPLCTLHDLPDNAGRGFVVGADAARQEIFLIRRGSTVYGYRNVCPHKGTNLDWSPDEFVDESGQYIQCATHGALFVVEDGLCVQGPCLGASLQPVPITVTTEGRVEVEVDVVNA